MNKEELRPFFKNLLIMFAITVVAGGILGFVYQLTKGPIAEMEQRTIDEANRKVFVNAQTFAEGTVNNALFSEVTAGKYEKVDITQVLAALDGENNILGYVMEVTSHEGYGGDIVFRIGFQNDGTINGISFTQLSETAGLGMRADEVLTPQFVERKADAFDINADNITSESHIDAISSATITSKAVVNAVNAAILYFDNELKGGNDDE